MKQVTIYPFFNAALDRHEAVFDLRDRRIPLWSGQRGVKSQKLSSKQVQLIERLIGDSAQIIISPDLGEDLGISGGLQPGMQSMDAAALDLDKSVRSITRKVWGSMALPGFSIKKKLSKIEMSALAGGEIDCGFQPDGGVIVDGDGKPLISFEAKKQGVVGNAHERMFKNLFLIDRLNHGSAAVVFMTGVGAGVGLKGGKYGMLGAAQTALTLTNRGVLNRFNLTGPSFFCRA